MAEEEHPSETKKSSPQLLSSGKEIVKINQFYLMPESPSPFQEEEGFPVLAGMIRQRVSGSATFAAEATYGCVCVYSTPAATGINCRYILFFPVLKYPKILYHLRYFTK
jgi:hypothetical protein